MGGEHGQQAASSGRLVVEDPVNDGSQKDKSTPVIPLDRVMFMDADSRPASLNGVVRDVNRS